MLDVAAAGFVSVVLNGPDDYVLAVMDADDTPLGESDRGGAGVEEALPSTRTAPSARRTSWRRT